MTWWLDYLKTSFCQRCDFFLNNFIVKKIKIIFKFSKFCLSLVLNVRKNEKTAQDVEMLNKQVIVLDSSDDEEEEEQEEEKNKNKKKKSL